MAGDPAPAHRRRKRQLHRHGHRPRRDRAPRRAISHVARNRRAGRAGIRRDRRLSASARRHFFDGQRDRGTRQSAARRALSTTPMPRSSARPSRSWAALPCIWASYPTTRHALAAALAQGLPSDVVVFSGGTSKGEGDVSYRVVHESAQPGHRRARRRAQAGQADLPRGHRWQARRHPAGFSDLGDLHVPRIRRAGDPRLAGLPAERRQTVARDAADARELRTRPDGISARRAWCRGQHGLTAYPMGKGSGSVTTFSGADGFITIDQHTEILDAGSAVSVQLLGQRLEPADLVVIGSHCVGLDLLIGKLIATGPARQVPLRRQHGRPRRGQARRMRHRRHSPHGSRDRRIQPPVAHATLSLVPGYGRMQGIVHRRGDARFEGRSRDEAVAAALQDPDCVMVNRNAGSGTRDHHRQDAGRAPARRLRHANQIAQRRGGRGGAGARGLGRGDRHRGQAVRARRSSRCRKSSTTSSCRRRDCSDRPCARSARCWRTRRCAGS